MITFLQGNCLDKIQELDDNSIDCVVTSPPYWGLRDYGVEGQLGLEPTYQEHIKNIVKIFRAIKPKLKETATIWLNYGDSYAATVNGTKVKDIKNDDRGFVDKPFSTIQGVLKPKDLVMIPNRIAIALQEAGWYIRSEIIWHKPNPMPESVKDRPTSAHEKIWLITKNKKYYYDVNAIKEDCVTKNKQASKKATHGKYQTKENEAKNRQGLHADRGNKLIEDRTKLPNQKDLVNFLRSKTTAKTLANNSDIPLTKIEHWFRYDETGFAYPTIEDWNKVKEFIDDWSNEFNLIDEALTYYELKTDEVKYTNKKNKRNVWTITTKPFKDAHFATFPKDLIEPCIKAGCPEGGTVLDPFGGSGTTAIVSKHLKRKAILIELNKEYISIAKKRIKKEFGLFK